MGAKAIGYFSHAQNFQTTSSGQSETSMGRYNSTNSTSVYNITNIALSVVNGTSEISRGNAFEVFFNGSVKGDMSYSTPASDYAEMFEWEDGNPENEDRVGYFVTLKKGIAAIPPPLASRKRSPYRIKMILPKQY